MSQIFGAIHTYDSYIPAPFMESYSWSHSQNGQLRAKTLNAKWAVIKMLVIFAVYSGLC